MLENYQIIQKIGEGMYGTVYLVQNQKKQKFALKTVKINPFDAEESLREVEATKLIEHPNLIKIYDYKIGEEYLQILMEYCQKGSFNGFMKNSQMLNNSEMCLSIFRQIIDAGVAMLRQGVIHRDIKPQNILIAQNSRGVVLKLADFGCATRQYEGSLTVISSSFQKGTAIYASPQLLDNQTYSSKCDVWSAGCLLYQMYFGVHPFYKGEIDKLKSAIQQFTSKYPFPANTHPRMKYFLKLALQYHERERASWKQMQLNMITLNRYNPACFEELLIYLHQLSGIVSVINKEIWENRKDIDLNKETHKAFAFYMTGLEYALHKMIIDLIEESEQFKGFYDGLRSKDITVYEKFLNKAKKNEQASGAVYEKIKGHLSQSSVTKKLVDKIPATRTTVFCHIEYSIKHAKRLLDQVFRSSNPETKVKQNRGYKLLSKWINFIKWFSIQKHPRLKDIEKEKVDRTTLSWIKQELTQADTLIHST